MVTVDHGIQHQQNMAGRGIAVIYLQFNNNSMDKLIPMATLVLASTKNLKPGQVLVLNHSEMR